MYLEREKENMKITIDKDDLNKYDLLSSDVLYIGDNVSVFCIVLNAIYNFVIVNFNTNGVSLLEINDACEWLEFEDVDEALHDYFETIKLFEGEMKLSN